MHTSNNNNNSNSNKLREKKKQQKTAISPPPLKKKKGWKTHNYILRWKTWNTHVKRHPHAYTLFAENPRAAWARAVHYSPYTQLFDCRQLIGVGLGQACGPSLAGSMSGGIKSIGNLKKAASLKSPCWNWSLKQEVHAVWWRHSGQNWMLSSYGIVRTFSH